MSRAKPAKAKLEEALLELLRSKNLQHVSVSELCSKAEVSRSTFYAHYSNVEDLYRTLVKGLATGTRTLKDQLRSNRSEAAPHRPFCEAIQDERFEGLVREDRFIQAFIDTCYEEFEDEAPGIYLDATQNRYVARMVNLFQLTGCLAIAKAGKGDPDWMQARKAVDTFIKGGVAALKNENRNRTGGMI